MMNHFGRNLFGPNNLTPTIVPGPANDAIVRGKVEIKADVYVDRGGGPERLVDILGITPEGGAYFLTLRGIRTEGAPIIWEGLEAIKRLRRGPSVAQNNNSAWRSLTRSLLNTQSKITNAKTNVNFLAMVGEVQKILKDGIRIEVRAAGSAGQPYSGLMSEADPFQAIDPRIGAGREFDWDLGDTSRFNNYVSVQKQVGQTESLVLNPFVSETRAQDFDSDTFMAAHFRLVNEHTGAFLGEFIMERKFPHTTHQIGSLLAKGGQDIEGTNVDPLKKYRKMVSPLGTTSKDHPYAGAGLFKIMHEQTAKLASQMSVSNLGKEKIAELIEKTVKEDLVGKATTKQWLIESLNFESMLLALPEFITEQFQLDATDVQTLKEKLKDPGFVTLLESKYNTGLKGERIHRIESILKNKNRSIEDTLFLGVEGMLSMNDKLRQKGDLMAEGSLAQLEATAAWAHLSEAERVRKFLGMDPKFIKTKRFVNQRGGQMFAEIPTADLKLHGIKGEQRDYLFNTLKKQKVFSKETGTWENLMDLQEIDFSSSLSKEYLDTIPAALRKKATTGYILAMKGFDESGNLVRMPLAGKFPENSVQQEIVHVLLPTRDPHTGTWTDPVADLVQRMEVQAKFLGSQSRINLFGLGELKGAFSVQNLLMDYKSKSDLARFNGIDPQRIQMLARQALDGNEDALMKLKGYKMAYDLGRAGAGATDQGQDLRRLMKIALGGLGLEATAVRRSDGTLVMKSGHTLKELATMVRYSTRMDRAEPGEIGALLASDTDFKFLPGTKQGEFGSAFVKRAMDINGRRVGLDNVEGRLMEYSRVYKGLGTFRNALDLGNLNIAVTTFDFDEESLKRLHGAWGENKKNPLGMDFIDQGFAQTTTAFQERLTQALIGDMEAGRDFSFKKEGKFLHPYKFKVPQTGEVIEVYLKDPINTQHLLTTNFGDLRIAAGNAGVVTATIGGKEVHLIVSAGEYFAKGKGAELGRELIKRMGAEAERAWDQFLARPYSETTAQQLVKDYGSRMGEMLEMHLNHAGGQESFKRENVFGIQSRVFARATDADKKLHRFSDWGSWNEALNTYLTENPDDPALELRLKGQAAKDAIADFAHRMYSSLSEAGAISEEFNKVDLTNVMLGNYAGIEASEPGGSLRHQLLYDKDEMQLVEIIKRNTANAESYEYSQMHKNRELQLAGIQDAMLQAGVNSKLAREGYFVAAAKDLLESGLTGFIKGIDHLL